MVYRMLMGEIMLIGIFVFDVYMLIYLFDQKYEFIFLFMCRLRMFCFGCKGI